MFTSNLVKNILSLLVIVAVVYLSFSYVTRPLDNSGVPTGIEVTSTDPLNSSNDPENLANVFADLLKKLATVDFQKGNPIFNNPVFQNGLISFSRELPEIDKERANPFAPLEGNPALYIRYPEPKTSTLKTSTTSADISQMATGTKATTTNR